MSQWQTLPLRIGEMAMAVELFVRALFWCCLDFHGTAHAMSVFCPILFSALTNAEHDTGEQEFKVGVHIHRWFSFRCH